MKSSETFREVVELIRKGEDISQEELVDCCGYAQDGVNELYILLKAFRDGYRNQQDALRRKDQKLEQMVRSLQSKDRIIWVLNQKIRKLGGETGTEDPSPTKRGED